MTLNLDNKNLSDDDKKIIVNNILIPMINKIQLGNKKIRKLLECRLNLDMDTTNKLYDEFKLNIKKIEIKINKNNLIKII